MGPGASGAHHVRVTPCNGLRDDELAEALGLTGVSGFGAVDCCCVRADLRATALMGDRDLWLNCDRRIVGPILNRVGLGTVHQG
ncbi:hypothetical protein E2562_028891 [Oryza meyeriana var. granulata]|uniref:Uncharacterized protein n=1 Tax=Oryza meyeriana var. granulata TaxID=110450 RepID=A0A6G1FDL1_9ORYZ|nr:hypothetical protein E2562_028891 [Oryza meyeriana var. granulata]